MTPRTKARPDTILLKGTGYHEEGRATSANQPLPGHLIAIVATADVPRIPPDITKNLTAGVAGPARVAKEDLLSGRGVDDAYVDNDVVPYHTCHAGDVVLLRVATDSEIAMGTKLQAAADGTVVAVSTGVPLFEAGESVDFTDEEDITKLFIRAVAL